VSFAEAFHRLIAKDGSWEKTTSLASYGVEIDGELVSIRGVVCSDGWLVGTDPSGLAWVLPPSCVGARS